MLHTAPRKTRSRVRRTASLLLLLVEDLNSEDLSRVMTPRITSMGQTLRPRSPRPLPNAEVCPLYC